MTAAERTAMLNVVTQYGKRVDMTVTHGDDVYSSEDIVSCCIKTDGDLFGSVMRCVELELDLDGGAGFAATMVGERITLAVTVTAGGSSVTRSFGTFIVKDAQYDDAYRSIKLTCYDLLLLSMVPYDATALQITYPVTLKAYLQAICSKLGITLGTDTFVSDSQLVDEEKYDSQYNWRQALTEIAQAAGGTIGIVDDELKVLYPTDSGIVLDPSNLKELTLDGVYGPVNSVVIARTPQEDNIYKRDETATSWTEVKIENNQIMDSHREDFLAGLYAAVQGLTYYPGEITSFGALCFELCETFAQKTLDGTSHTLLYTGGEITIAQGLTEVIKSQAPGATKTEYAAASESDRKVNQTILRVDKQEQRIDAVVKTAQDVSDKSVQLESSITATNSQLALEVSRIEDSLSETDGEVKAVAARMELLEDQWTVEVSERLTKLEETDEGLKEYNEELKKRMSFSASGGLEISAGDQEPRHVIDNGAEVIIMPSGEEVFRADKKGTSTPQVVTNTLRMGAFAWVTWTDSLGRPRLSLQKVSNE